MKFEGAADQHHEGRADQRVGDVADAEEMLKVLAHFEDHADRADHTQREQEARVGQNGQQHDADGNGRVDEVRANEAALVDRDRETGQVLEQENNAEDESRPIDEHRPLVIERRQKREEQQRQERDDG